MRRHRPRVVAIVAIVAAMTGCGDRVSEPDGLSAKSARAAAGTTRAPTATPIAAGEAAGPVERPSDAPDVSEFAPAPAVGQVLRANCRMGGCWWYRYLSVQREAVPSLRYRLALQGGESGPHPGDYPLDCADAVIRWDAAPPIEAIVDCSLQAPRVSFGGNASRLALNPRGVSGVEQGMASLYFATCHGGSGDDAVLAREYGYDVK